MRLIVDEKKQQHVWNRLARRESTIVDVPVLVEAQPPRAHAPGTAKARVTSPIGDTTVLFLGRYIFARRTHVDPEHISAIDAYFGLDLRDFVANSKEQSMAKSRT